MQRIPLYHDRIFSDREFAEKYHQGDAKYIAMQGKSYANLLKKKEFTGGKIFDSGCGFGAVPIAIARAFPETQVYGADLSDPLLEIANKQSLEAGVADRVHFTKGDVTELDFDDDEFDVVTCTFMLHLVENPVAMLNEIERVAKPEGIILITDLRRTVMGYLMKKLKTVLTLGEALEIIRQSNLRPGRTVKGLWWWDYFAGV